MESSNCCECGSCCFTDHDRYVLVTQPDHARLGELAGALTHFRNGMCFMRVQDGHCAALQITRDGQFLCSVYEQRPEICRALERGSSVCGEEIRDKHHEARSALARIQGYDVPAQRLSEER